MPLPTTRVVIIGGGFGGLYAAQALRRAAVDVTLVDRRNFHLFQPLLYQVATGGLSPGDIASPLRYVLRRQRNTRVVLGEVRDVDLVRRRVVLSDGEIDYEFLIAAAGATHHYFGHDEWAIHAPGLKTVEDATGIRSRILLAFETAEREPDPARRRAWLTFVVVGAGPTGVELAGALGEIANDALRRDFRAIRPADAEIFLLEAADRVLPPYPPRLSEKAKRSLERLGVTVLLGRSVAGIDADGVLVRSGGREERIDARTVLWAAGVDASPLAQVLARASGAVTDRNGRVVVQPDLTLPGHPNVFVIGDMAHAEQDGALLPGVAPVAMAEGKYAAHCILARAAGKQSAPFRYVDKGQLATIGRSAAVADIRGIHFSGLLAWIVWLFVHIVYLVEFEHRLLVLVQWAWYYVTRHRGTRLITGESPLPLPITTSTPRHLAGDRADEELSKAGS